MPQWFEDDELAVGDVMVETFGVRYGHDVIELSPQDQGWNRDRPDAVRIAVGFLLDLQNQRPPVSRAEEQLVIAVR